MDTWRTLDEERSALSEDLARLEAAQWEVPSLCAEWRVRHVVGHLLFGADMKFGPVMAGLLRNGMNFDRYVAREGLARGAASPDSLVQQFKLTIGKRQLMLGAKPEILLVDLVCHSQDIRRPTGLHRSVPESTLVMVANTMRGFGFPVYSKKRIADLRLSATDFEWSTSTGPRVDGPLSSLILAMAGRRAALDDLSGEGIATLQSRM